MRLLSYSHDSSADAAGGPVHGWGLLSADGAGVVDLGRRIPDVDDLGRLIEQQRLGAARDFVDDPADHQLADLTFERLLPWPRKIFCIGVNYGGRSAEYADATDAAYPSVFVRFPDSFTGHERALIRPPESPQLDYEGEIVAVIGTPGRRIPIADARNHIAGLTLGNEGTIRDWVRHAKFNVTQGKNWESTGAMGPWLVPIDEIGDFEQLRLTTRVNGELRQDDTPATMKYPIEYQVHYLSTFATLHPGDVIFTGTPTGAGARHDPPVWLEPGDTVEISVPEIGTLRNTIADEFPDGTDIVAPEPR
ncbi:MAG: fumarylacetoacetate hydrolase family protein [Acidimicrobiia bacterium]|nr:fumarylacetoacetate hydrolase family protein [Acidimicrobiia bacterium]